MSSLPFSPRNLEYKPEHQRSASWFAALCVMMGNPRLQTNCYLQNDGSQVFKFAEEKGRDHVYYVRVWPDGEMKGGRAVPMSE